VTAAQPTESRRAPTVLVIDDEDYVADMLASALELEGYTVHLAYNGRDGLALGKRLPIDLLIIDIMMPYISGTALVDTFRKLDHTAGVPIILISAGARPPQQQPSVRFVPKPFNIDSMIELVATLIDESSA
jgi:CheY-like chemotaxis protein